MNTQQAINHRVLRCRPGDAETYRHKHMSLAGYVSPAEELAFMEKHYAQPVRRSFFQRIRQAWKALWA